MPPQDQTPVKDADLEQMQMNMKEGDRYVVNHGEGLTIVDFGGHVSLVEKEGAGIAERRELIELGWTTEEEGIGAVEQRQRIEGSCWATENEEGKMRH
ncbi:hypothetical protein B296_00044861 [Ensete ventricosum]|uniref:Uncharacterized protein n=1 Tax=Ensete ventricosum TaxID=4639 RepID=A0A426YHF3_ENSVE|nr:hypothetical protein B296_00044861 [Ensete ventricosum]